LSWSGPQCSEEQQWDRSHAGPSSFMPEQVSFLVVVI
jgi:hypothetical protein